MNASIALATLLALSSADRDSVSALQQLSAKQFKVRENAAKHLASAMPRVRLLVQTGLASEDTETRRRCARILAEYRRTPLERLRWWAEVMPERWPHFDMCEPRLYPSITGAEPPIPDMMGHGTRGELWRWYFARACAVESVGITRSCGKPDFETYRAATLWYVADLERAGLEAWQVRAFLDSLVPLEKEWYKSAGFVRP